MSLYAWAVLWILVMYPSAPAVTVSEENTQEKTVNDSIQQVKTIQNMTVNPIFEFDKKSEPWQIINDGVMGGLSSSRFTLEKDLARFEGSVSLENNGGFASIRSRPRDRDVSPFQGILLRVRGDGKRYTLRLRNTSALDGISYQTHFTTVPDQWIMVRLPFEAFQPVFRGRLVRNAEPLDLKSVKTFGVLIADRQAGEFRLEIAWIKAYIAEAEEGG